MSIKNIAVAGGSGNLGQFIVKELVAAGFTVTLLTRADKPAPEGVAGVKVVDYKSVEALTAALQGQDGVVSALGSLAVGEQTPLVDAAVAAGVKRFIPSEFGVNTRKARGTTIGGVLAPKVGTVDHLIRKADASAGAFTWTGISTGLFFDWGIEHGLFGFDVKAKKATIYDSGNEPFQVSTFSYIGQAVAAVFRQAGEHFGTAGDKTANQYIEISSFTPSQNDLLRILEAETGGASWPVTKVSTADLLKEAQDKLAKGDFSAFVQLLTEWQYKDGAKHTADIGASTGGNALLGLKETQDLKSLLKSWVAKNQ